MKTVSESQFSAADSLVGYLYQVRVALLWSLRRLKLGSEFIVSLETLDDVMFESTGGSPEELLQTKHHRNREAALTDASVDLWKSLRVWFEGIASTSVPIGTALHLITTGRASPGSAAAYLRVDGRDVGSALGALEAVARSSNSETNAAAYAAFLKAKESTRKAVLESVIVIDAAPTATSIDTDLKSEVFLVVDRKHHEAFLDRLEGWWLRRTLKQLVSHSIDDRVSSAEIEAQMSGLRDQFKQDSLPIDLDLLNYALDDTTNTAHKDYPFVQQLELIAVGKKRVAAAVRDYYRAFEQRSRWLRDDLLLIGDLTLYEKRLSEEWELVFEAMKDNLGENVAEAEMQKAARDVLEWAEQVSIPIRPRVTEPFVTRGSLHMLADEIRIGWHRDFRERLASLIGTKETAA